MVLKSLLKALEKCMLRERLKVYFFIGQIYETEYNHSVYGISGKMAWKISTIIVFALVHALMDISGDEIIYYVEACKACGVIIRILFTYGVN